MLKIKRADIAITTKCNFTCRYCRGNPGERMKMPCDEVLKIIDNFNDLGVKNIRLDGGEPFLYGDEMFHILDYIEEKKLECGVFTNASTITFEIAKRLKKYNNITLFVTLHILNPISEFEKTLKGLKILSEAEIDVELILIVSQKNLPVIIDYIKPISELGYQLTLRPIIPIGKAFKNMDQGFAALTQEDIQRFELLLKEIHDKYTDLKVVNAVSNIYDKVDGYHDKNDGFVLHVNTNSELLPSFAAGNSKYLGSALDLDEIKKKLEHQGTSGFLKNADSAVLNRINGAEYPTDENIELKD